VSDYLKQGDKVRVKLVKIDNGKYSLSRKEVLKEENSNNGGK
jgi:predicted RNA-binding protein with RPS1 domain